MIPVALDEVRALELGRLEPGAGDEITGVRIDSRLVGPGDLFVAVAAGVDFVGEAQSRGAATLVSEAPLAALAALARLVRDRSRARIVGITGSTGKTSTKDILAALCAPVARTVAAEASFNNELGVPLTLCRLEPETEVLIVELGMRGFGQIAELCAYVRPDIGVITVIGPGHLERVGDLDGVARAKGELLAALPAGGTAIVPAGVAALEPFLRDDLDLRRVPSIDDADVERDEIGATIRFRGRELRFPLTARHQVANALTALEAYDALGLPLDRASEGAATASVSRWRGDELPLPGGGVAINDAFNANPDSMRAALLNLRERAGAGRALAVLGGMAELGDHAARYHREAAALARELGVEVVAVGELARLYEAEDWTDGPDAAVDRVRELLRPGDTVLVKASRSVGLEGVAPALANRARTWSES
jgi:UDP-N-acetylmuramoyl-tripeptide--D-alanyl-D-alanine ligase